MTAEILAFVPKTVASAAIVDRAVSSLDVDPIKAVFFEILSKELVKADYGAIDENVIAMHGEYCLSRQHGKDVIAEIKIGRTVVAVYYYINGVQYAAQKQIIPTSTGNTQNDMIHAHNTAMVLMLSLTYRSDEPDLYMDSDM